MTLPLSLWPLSDLVKTEVRAAAPIQFPGLETSAALKGPEHSAQWVAVPAVPFSCLEFTWEMMGVQSLVLSLLFWRIKPPKLNTAEGHCGELPIPPVFCQGNSLPTALNQSLIFSN